jgi:hypothetical protein
LQLEKGVFVKNPKNSRTDAPEISAPSLEVVENFGRKMFGMLKERNKEVDVVPLAELPEELRDRLKEFQIDKRPTFALRVDFYGSRPDLGVSFYVLFQGRPRFRLIRLGEKNDDGEAIVSERKLSEGNNRDRVVWADNCDLHNAAVIGLGSQGLIVPTTYFFTAQDEVNIVSAIFASLKRRVSGIVGERKVLNAAGDIAKYVVEARLYQDGFVTVVTDRDEGKDFIFKWVDEEGEIREVPVQVKRNYREVVHHLRKFGDKFPVIVCEPWPCTHESYEIDPDVAKRFLGERFQFAGDREVVTELVHRVSYGEDALLREDMNHGIMSYQQGRKPYIRQEVHPVTQWLKRMVEDGLIKFGFVTMDGFWAKTGKLNDGGWRTKVEVLGASGRRIYIYVVSLESWVAETKRVRPDASCFLLVENPSKEDELAFRAMITERLEANASFNAGANCSHPHRPMPAQPVPDGAEKPAYSGEVDKKMFGGVTAIHETAAAKDQPELTLEEKRSLFIRRAGLWPFNLPAAEIGAQEGQNSAERQLRAVNYDPQQQKALFTAKELASLRLKGKAADVVSRLRELYEVEPSRAA